jgi:hypothetical protein
MLLRRQLPILSPCDRFEADPNDPERCVPCARAVHDLGKLDEAGVLALLASHGGGGLCVAYATRADGAIALRRPMRPAAPLLATMLLGCAGYGHDPVPTLDGGCDDANAGRSGCADQLHGDHTVVPDEAPTPARSDDEPADTVVGHEVDSDDPYDLPITGVERGFVAVITTPEMPAAKPAAPPTASPPDQRTPRQRRRDARRQRRAR